MSETKWRECDDPEVLAAAVAAGAEVQCVAVDGRTWETGCDDSASFRRCMANDCRYRLPAGWSPAPEPPDGDEPCATNPCEPPADDLRERIARVIDDWHNTVEMWTELDDLADAVLAVLPAPPVPPWPGAVLSGLVDEDGQPTWIALAPNVQGEAVRTCIDFPWFVCGSDNATTPYWVEVRAPRAPETELVPWWEAKDRNGLAGDPFVEVGSDDEGPWVRVVEGGTKLHSPVAPDGTVEVLKDGES